MARRYNKNGTDDTRFGRVIRRAMTKRRLSRDDLRKRLGVSGNRVSQLFTYQHMPQRRLLGRLAKALDVDEQILADAAWESRGSR